MLLSINCAIFVLGLISIKCADKHKLWALNVASGIIKGLGFEVIYGDTDIVMYTLEPCSESRSLVNNNVDHINEVHVDTEPTNIMEFVSGNKNVIATDNLHLLTNTFEPP